MSKYKYTNQQLIDAIASSTSIRQVLYKLDIKAAGGNYSSVKKRITSLGIDISHFTGKASNKGKTFAPKRDIKDYLSNNFPVGSHRLRKRLIREGLFVHKCYVCNNDKWNGIPISLELEHIDGNHQNNSIDNLTLLCPNCHAQTSTYRGRNKKVK